MRTLLALFVCALIVFSIASTPAEARTYSLCDGPGMQWGLGAAACAACISGSIWGNGDISICFGNMVIDIGGDQSMMSSGLKQPVELPTPVPSTRADADGMSGRK